MKKRGQAAMEFLMTYGWAILAAIIVIGVLAIYFRPSALTTQSQVVTAPFYAVGSAINTTTVQLELRNNGVDTLEVTAMSFTTIRNPTDATCGSGTTNVNITSGDTAVLSVGCTGLNVGDSFSGDVEINYYQQGTSLQQRSTGTISGTVA